MVLRAGRRTANTGIYIFEPEILEHLDECPGSDLARDVLPFLVERELLVVASQQEGFWLPITSHEYGCAAGYKVLDTISSTRPYGWLSIRCRRSFLTMSRCAFSF